MKQAYCRNIRNVCYNNLKKDLFTCVFNKEEINLPFEACYIKHKCVLSPGLEMNFDFQSENCPFEKGRVVHQQTSLSLPHYM